MAKFKRGEQPECVRCGHSLSFHGGDKQVECRALGCDCPLWLGECAHDKASYFREVVIQEEYPAHMQEGMLMVPSGDMRHGEVEQIAEERAVCDNCGDELDTDKLEWV